MNHQIPMNKAVRRKGVTIAAAALSVALVAPFAQSVAYPEITAAAQAQEDNGPVRVGKRLKQQPPVFYANSFGHSNESPVVKARKLTSARAVRTTGVLSLPDTDEYKDIPTFFPKGTKFEPARLDFEFTERGWFGVARENETETEKLVGSERTHMISQGGGKAHPYVVPETGQVLFGLMGSAEGTTEKVPLRARWTDPKTGNNYVWLFEQEIQVGLGRVPGGRKGLPSTDNCKPGQSLVSPSTEKKLRHTGAFKLGSENNLGGSNFGWYQQPTETGKPAPKMGDSAACLNNSDIPSLNPNVVHPEFKMSKQVEPKYGVPGAGAVTSGEPTFHAEGNEAEGKQKPAGVRFGKGDNAPAGVTVDSESGVVTLDNPVAERTTVPVKVTYEDGSVDEVSVVFSPADAKTADTVEPKYDAPAEGATESGAPKFHEQGKPENGVDAPDGVRFELGDDAPAGAKVNPDTGVVSFDKPVDKETTVPVKAVYKDGSSDTANVVFKPAAKKTAEQVEPEWNDTNLPDDGSRVNVPNTGDEIPHDTDVDLLVGYGEHNKGEQDWTVRLEEDGSITVIPGGDAAPEDSIEVHVELTYADGSTETKTFIVKVPLTFEGFFPENLGEPDYPNSEGSDRPNTPNTTHGEFGPITGEDSGDITAGDVFDQADRFDPEWNDTDTPEDGSAVTVNNTGDDLPHGATVELGWGHGLHNKGTQDWDVELEENGDITVTPGADAEHGDSVLVQAVITYADGSTETKEFIVQVPVSGEEYVPGNFGEYGPMLQSEETELTAEEAFGQAEMIEPNWADTNTPEDGSPVTVKNTGDALPHGTKVDLGWGHGTHNKGTQDWDVDLEENGDITVKPGADAKPGDSIVVEVSITYPDGTKETKSFVTQVPVTGEEFVPGNFGELPVLTGDDNDDLTAGDVFTEAPTVNPVNPGDNTITGTGKPGATITVTGPNGFSTTTKVNENGKWSIDVPGGATPESQYIVSQKDGDKAESDQVLVKVGKGNEPLPKPGSSLGSSNFDIPRHLQCAVFAGGVTAIPLILLSPLHNMYELVMNPHLAGLREQFNREIHAIDQQVRRSVGPEGRAALDVLDHINGRVHQFNQQLGQFAHENRHIGLAAAAIAVAGLSYQHCMNTQANQSSSATGSSVDLSSSSSEQQAESRGIVGWFQGLFNRK